MQPYDPFPILNYPYASDSAIGGVIQQKEDEMWRPKSEKATPRQLQFISQFSTDIRHIKGQDNIVADALSRIEELTLLDYDEIAERQRNDEELRNLQSTSKSLNFKQYPLSSGKYLWCDTSTRPYIPEYFRFRMFQRIHGLSHPGTRSTVKQMSLKFIWTSIKKDVRQWARFCIPCKKNKVARHTKSNIGEFQDPMERFTEEKSLCKEDIGYLKGTIKQIKDSVCELIKLDENVSKIEGCLQTNLDEIKNELCKFATKSTTKDTYADMVKNKIGKSIQKDGYINEEKTLIISANNNLNVSGIHQLVSEKIKLLRQEGNKAKITNIINTKNGTIIKSPNEEDIDQLLESFKNTDEINKISKVYKPKLRDPNILIKSVNKITDITNLPTILCNMNPELDNLQDHIKVLFPIKSNRQEQDILLRVSTQVYQILKKTGKVYTDIQRCEVRDKILVSQCQNCFENYPKHRTNNCPNLKNCVKCGQEGQHLCSGSIKCCNCTKHPYFKNGNQDHKPNSKDCPIYAKQIEYTMQKTAYTTTEPQYKNE
ncbi:hypothetical protein LAZ67_8003251 [Cordylochernes scorpioides]|uniref:Integrase zinc-binding domain-containing protein n=1 Tax=Cordylochernes scorpioides TaxID=51811 RepID=A0ABY6KU79_9ARAC|nr:hypothetical protein LAZ67_8003251 [Cordylochernes scorpioides]